MTKYPLASSTWDDAEYRAIQSVIESDMYTMGPQVAQYEQDFARFFGSRYAVMVSSGSTANLLMIAALFFTKNPRLKRGDEVIVPAVSWSTTYFPLQQYGLKVKFVDIDRSTLNIDVNALSTAIGPNTKAILAVNLLGNPNDFDRLQSLAKEHDLILLEDNCESMGAEYNGKLTGTFGLMGTFSSFFSHHIATMEGGCIVTDDLELYHILLCIRAHGWTRNLPKFNEVTGEKSDDAFEESFKFVLPGYNVRPLEMSGALGIQQLKKLTNFVEVRRANALIFKDVVSKFDVIETQNEIGNSSWFGFSMVLAESAPYSRADLVRCFTAHNIECRPIVTGNFLKNVSVLKYFDYEIHGQMRNAEYIDQNGLFVGNHQVDLHEQLELLEIALKSL